MLIEPRGRLGSNDLASELAAGDAFAARNRPMLLSACAHVGVGERDGQRAAEAVSAEGA